MSRQTFGRILGIAILGVSYLGDELAYGETKRPLNILLFTADDLNCDSLGCYGCPVAEITPNLDRFASEGMRFERAHVNVAICQPSRGVLATGRYSHRSGITGFYHTDRDIPTVMEMLREAEYLTGILSKVNHSTPKADYEWDYVAYQADLGAGRNPKLYGQHVAAFLARAKSEKRPFYFMVNSNDPHRPYHIPSLKNKKLNGAVAPSRIYEPGEIRVPGFLPDLSGVRQEIAYYFNSVKRLDDTFGQVMKALEESGYADNTLVVFLSDNGIAVPFAKCNCYLASTRTPWIVRWPGRVAAGSLDRTHFISGVDSFPTVMEAVGLPIPEGLDGRSIVSLLAGSRQDGREVVFTQIDQKAGNGYVPMRCVQDERFGYIFNPWSDGQTWYRNNNEGLCMKAMQEAAKTDASIAARVDLFRYRVQEEFYDLQNDPDCLENLVDDPKYAAEFERYRQRMADWMQETGDPILASFVLRGQPDQLKSALEASRPHSPAKKPKKKSGKKNKKRQKPSL